MGAEAPDSCAGARYRPRRSRILTLTVTLDTNVLQEHWRDQDKAGTVERLLDLNQSGRVDLAVTTRIDADIPHAPLADRIDELPEIGVDRIRTAFRIGVSPIGGEDVIVGPEMEALDAILREHAERHGTDKRRPDWRDADHLYGHMVAGRDVFLTWDGGILRLAAELRERLRIRVMRPEEFLEEMAQGGSMAGVVAGE